MKLKSLNLSKQTEMFVKTSIFCLYNINECKYVKEQVVLLSLFILKIRLNSV